MIGLYSKSHFKAFKYSYCGSVILPAFTCGTCPIYVTNVSARML